MDERALEIAGALLLWLVVSGLLLSCISSRRPALRAPGAAAGAAGE